MRLFKSFTILSVILFYMSLSAQEKILLSGKIDWAEYNETIQNLHELNTSDYYYFSRHPLNEKVSSATVHLINGSFEPLNTPLSKIIQRQITSTEIPIQSEIVTERKKSVLNYSFLPYRINPTSGAIEKLTNYTLELTTSLVNKKNTRTYATQSLLSKGNWFKIKVDTTGVFKLTYEQLKQIGLTNPEQVQLFGYGGAQLPYMNSSPNFDDLVELPLFMEKGSDNTFGVGDYVLFFTGGSVSWSYDETKSMFIHQLHDYSKYTYLFLTSDRGEGLRINTESIPGSAPTTTSNSFDSYQCYESELYNLIESGRTWYGERFRQGNTLNLSFTFPALITAEPVKLLTNIAGRKEKSAPACYFNYRVNGNQLTRIDVNDSYSDYTYAKEYSRQIEFNTNQNNIGIDLSFGGGNTASEGYLDYICLNAREKLVYRNKQMLFRDKKTVAENQITAFQLDNSGVSVLIWDVTNPIVPKALSVNHNGNQSTIKVASNVLREFLVFKPSDAFTPIIEDNDLGPVANQNLHGIEPHDMVIVSHPLFLEQAGQIAEIHRIHDGLSVFITTPEQIYNEYSSGTPDVSAIRNFMRMLYERASSEVEMPKYLLLFGDGSYDNRTKGNGNSNLIPTYQSINSLSETISYVSDDFFGLLDPNEGEYLGALDIGIGRFPVQNTDEAQLMVDKVKQYLWGKTSSSDWKSTVCFIGDDGDGGLHMLQPDQLSKSIYSSHPEFNVKKIYLDAYHQISTPSGQRFPDVTEAINQQVDQGALIIDYVGHGNPRILTHEEVLTSSDVRSWTNYDKLSVFVTASCEVGRFDDYSRISLGEWFLLNPNGGGIATLTTTRVVYSGGNHNLNTNFINVVFNTDLRLGDIIRIAKVNTSGTTNKRNFTLLGDPALKLAIPENKANVFDINGKPVPFSQQEFMQNEPGDKLTIESFTLTALDTLNALSKANISGYIQQTNEQVVAQNGTLFISVFDKMDTLYTFGQDNQVVQFQMQDKLLYKGKASITNGYFNFDFIVPKDINYKFGAGKISLRAQLDSTEAIGYFSDFIIGGNAEKANTDFNGPEIKLYMNDTLFVNGGTTNENPVLLAVITDESGVNTTGNGFGHNITAVLDNNPDKMFILNNFYQGAMDKYNCGEVRYPLKNLTPGYHSINFKTWDVYNNSSESVIEFYVHDLQSVVIDKLQNLPNPFYNHTYFTFEHNQAHTDFNVRIEVFDMMGTKVSEINQNQSPDGYKIEPIRWDGTSIAGAKLSRGVYIYKATLSTIDGQKTTQSSKLMIFE